MVTKTKYRASNNQDILTHPHKILYKEDQLSKLDIANYYTEVQKWILPHIINRPLTLVRCPDGYNKCFYQKHIAGASSLYNITIKEKEGKSNYVYIKDMGGLMALIQLGVLEIHPWNSRIDHLEHPDLIIFDIDPSPEIPWKKVAEAAKNIQKNLSKIKLKSFLKTTGGKGLHIVVPILPEYTWNEIKQFSKTFVEFLVLKYPGLYVSTLSKSKRKGKIFIDYLRNQSGATSVAPYSTRAKIHAPISTPLSWRELTDDAKDTFFTVQTLPRRLKKIKTDPWKDFFRMRQSLNI